jgi:spermidine synthase
VAAGAPRGGRAAGAAAVAALGLAAAGPGGEFRPAEPDTGRVVAEYDTSYQFLQVREVPEGGGKVSRLLTMNEGVSTYHSVFRPGSVLTGGRYYDLYPALPLLAGAKAGKPFRVLILGYAAGTQARAMRAFWGKAASLEIDGAEIDPEVLRAGRERFESPEGEPGVRVRAVDARAFLAAVAGEGRLYNLVLLDCYHREFYLPFHLASVEFFREVKERLAPGGLLAFNAFAYRPDDPLLSTLLGTVAEAFGSAWLCPVPYYPNYVVLASPRPSDLPLLAFSEAADAAADGTVPRDPAWAALAAHPEAKEVLRLASRCAAAATPRRREPGAEILTDDRAPVERLADRAVREYDDARRGAR